MTVAAGTLSAQGQLTRNPEQTRLVIRQLGVAKPVVEYVQVTPSDQQRVEKATKETTEARERPAVRVDLDRAEVTGGTFGFTNERGRYPYRLFLADTDITLAGFSNERSQRDGVANVRGLFMDSGPAAVDARFEGSGSACGPARSSARPATAGTRRGRTCTSGSTRAGARSARTASHSRSIASASRALLARA
jgi:hypothetical protein